MRVLAPKGQKELKKSNTHPMDFTGKPMKEMVFVATEGFQSEVDLVHWVNLGIEHAEAKAK